METQTLPHKEAKTYIDNIISFVKYTVETCAIADEKYERYSTALNFLVSAKGIFTARTPKDLTKEAALITIDVVKEIALMSEMLDGTYEDAVKSAALIAKLAIEGVDRL